MIVVVVVVVIVLLSFLLAVRVYHLRSKLSPSLVISLS